MVHSRLRNKTLSLWQSNLVYMAVLKGMKLCAHQCCVHMYMNYGTYPSVRDNGTEGASSYEDGLLLQLSSWGTCQMGKYPHMACLQMGSSRKPWTCQHACLYIHLGLIIWVIYMPFILVPIFRLWCGYLTMASNVQENKHGNVLSHVEREHLIGKSHMCHYAEVAMVSLVCY